MFIYARIRQIHSVELTQFFLARKLIAIRIKINLTMKPKFSFTLLEQPLL